MSLKKPDKYKSARFDGYAVYRGDGYTIYEEHPSGDRVRLGRVESWGGVKRFITKSKALREAQLAQKGHKR